jgi:hypothetical protein
MEEKKNQFLRKWSNWWILTKDSEKLNEAFTKELNEVVKESLLSKDRENIRLRALIDSEQAWALKYEELAIENERLKGLIDKAVIFGCDSRNEEYMTISHQDTLKEFKKKNNL